MFKREHFLPWVHVHYAFAVKDVRIPISHADGTARHLLLTGERRSGKSAVLKGIYQALAKPHCSDEFVASQRKLDLFTARLELLDPKDPQCIVLRKHQCALAAAHERLMGTPHVSTSVNVLSDWLLRDALFVFLPAGRPPGFCAAEVGKTSSGRLGTFLDWLVHLRADEVWDRKMSDHVAGKVFAARRQLREILRDPYAQVVYDPTGDRYQVVFESGVRVGLDELPDGIPTLLRIWADLIVRAEAFAKLGVVDPRGWVILDEPELHLHPRLHRGVLSFLAELLPNAQLVVATRSKEVLASLSNAASFDLSRQAVPQPSLAKRGVLHPLPA